MPKLYEYLGIMIMFYSNEHAPIHVHGKHAGRVCRAEINVQNGKVTSIEFYPVGPGLAPDKQKEFEKFVCVRAGEIVEKWVDFFVYRKTISPERITRRI